MSDETQVSDDKEQNLAALRAKAEALEAQLAALKPLAVEKTVREAGFDPATPAGKALVRLADESADADAVKALAAELGFETAPPAERHEPTQEEKATQAFADKLSQLNSVTTSDTPTDWTNKVYELQTEIESRAEQGLPTRHLVGQQIDLMLAESKRLSGN